MKQTDRNHRPFEIICIGLLTLAGVAGCADGRFKSPEDWNKKERGAAIGGASGAALGAMVGSQSGNTGAGALVGG
ncbi:MAG: hypothetical protein KDD44_14510, partial [Bdellovibrionales bacterium]|nr:hypothetical protein [Bdellovibrionales bacterium]